MNKETVSHPAAGGQRFPLPDGGVAFKFLDFMFGELNSGYVEFRYFGPGPKPRVVDQSTYHTLPLDNSKVASEVLSRASHQMITFGPAPRCRVPARGSAGRDQDVLLVGCLWADLDFKQAGSPIDVYARIDDFPLRPSVVVDSGYGRHLYFVFNAPLRSSQLLEWYKMISSLRDALRGDAVVNLSRVMRLPGTLNLKEPVPVPCTVCEEESSWTRYSLEEVRGTLQKAGSPRTSLPYQKKRADDFEIDPVRVERARHLAFDMGERYDVPDDVVRAVTTGERTIRTGVNAGRDDDASGRDYWIACTLLEKGVDEDDVRDLFRAHPNGCGSKWALRQHGEAYLDLTIQKALQRVAEKRARAAENNGYGGEEEEGVGDLVPKIPPLYRLGADGSIWLDPPDDGNGGKPKSPVKICNSFIRIEEIQENVDSGQISVVISFDYLGRTRSTTIARSQMVDARQLVAALGGEGAPITSNNARLVIGYLAAYEHAFGQTVPRKKIIGRFGRGRGVGASFFLPGLANDVEFAPTGPGDASLYRAYASRRGTLKDWVEIMHAIADSSLMIPQVAILTAFIPPLQSVLQIPNFLLDIHGNTSTGKSTSLRLAASVYGKPNDPDALLMQWMNTKVAVEQIAHMCSELPVFLDDAQHCPDDLKRAVVYMIANGKGKGRGAKGGGIRETATWHTVALSTSEEPLHESSPSEGARGRILPVGGLTPPFRAGMGGLVQALDRAVTLNHGHAGEAYIRHINGWTHADWSAWQKRYSVIRAEMLRRSSSDLIGRVSGYISAIQLAGEIVCPLLGLSFVPDMIGAWLMLHLDEQQQNQNLVLLALRALADHYVSNMNLFAGTAFYDQDRSRGLHGAAKPQVYVGFLRDKVDEIFQKRKWNSTAVLNKLAEAGAVHATEGDRYTKKVSVGGVQHRMICVKWSAILPEDLPAVSE